MDVGSICGFSTPTPPPARETSPASFPSIANAGVPAGDFALKSGDEPAEITHMLFGITGLYFPGRPAAKTAWVSPGAAGAWNGVATPGEIGTPGDLPVPAR